MKLITIYNYDGKQEHIRADQIESVVEPSGTSYHGNGCVVLLGGRRIGLGREWGGDQAERIVRQMREEQ